MDGRKTFGSLISCALLAALFGVGCGNPVVHTKAERRLPPPSELKRVTDDFIERALAPPKPAETTGLFLDRQNEYWYEARFKDEVSAADLEAYREHVKKAGLYYRSIGPSGHNPLGNILRYEQCFMHKLERKHWAVAVACFWTSDLPSGSQGFTDAAVPYHREGQRLLVYLGDPQNGAVWNIAQPIPDRDRVSMKEPAFGRAPGLILVQVLPPSSGHDVSLDYVSETQTVQFYLEDYSKRLSALARCSSEDPRVLRCVAKPGLHWESVWVDSNGAASEYLPPGWEKRRPDLAEGMPKTGIRLDFSCGSEKSANALYNDFAVKEKR